MISIALNYHQKLADYYYKKHDLYLDKDEENPNTRKLVELPWQQTMAQMWPGVTETLCDLFFIQAKCADKLTYDLIKDYQFALDNLPEAQKAGEKEKKHQERLNKYIMDLIAYAEGKRKKLEVIPSVNQRSKEELAKERKMIQSNPSQADRLTAFFRFVESELFSLELFGSKKGFCLQQAYNFSKNGPVNEATEKIINDGIDNIFILRSPKQRPSFNIHPLILKTLEGHAEVVSDLSITPDGKRAVSFSIDDKIRVWDLEELKCIDVFRADTGYQYSGICITADGKRVLFGYGRGDLFHWDLESFKCIHRLKSHSARIISISITPDGKYAISGSEDETFKIWNLERGECLKTYAGQRGVVTMTPDNKYAISTGAFDDVQIWDLKKARSPKTIERKNFGRVNVMRYGDYHFFSWNHENQDSSLFIWDAERGECVNKIELEYSKLRYVSVTSDGKRAIATCEDHNLRVLNFESGECIKTINYPETKQITSLIITADGRRAVSGSWDKTIRVWDLERGMSLETEESPMYVGNTIVSLDGKDAISSGVSDDWTMRIWNLEKGKCIQSLQGCSDSVYNIFNSPDGECFISASRDNLQIWNLKDGICQKTIYGDFSSTKNVITAPDGKRCITNKDRILSIYDMVNGKLLFKIEEKKHLIVDPYITPDSKFLITVFTDDSIRIWNLESGDCQKEIIGDKHTIQGSSISPDGKLVFSKPSNLDDSFRVWDLFTGEFLRDLKKYPKGASITEFLTTSDGRWIVSCPMQDNRKDNKIRIIAIKTGQCIRTLDGHTDQVTKIRLLPGSKILVSISDDKSVRVWNLISGDCIALFRQNALFRSDTTPSLSNISTNGNFTLVPLFGKFSSYSLYNLKVDPPIVTAVRIRRYENNNYVWEEKISVECLWCGLRFPIEDKILKTIKGIEQNARLTPDQSPCLELPNEAWDEPGLVTECSICHRPVRLNPFVVDNKDRYY